jgi:hypothetical protein
MGLFRNRDAENKQGTSWSGSSNQDGNSALDAYDADCKNGGNNHLGNDYVDHYYHLETRNGKTKYASMRCHRCHRTWDRVA